MLLMNDEELLEGLIGGIGWILAVFYIRNGLYKKYGILDKSPKVHDY